MASACGLPKGRDREIVGVTGLKSSDLNAEKDAHRFVDPIGDAPVKHLIIFEPGGDIRVETL